MELIDPFQRRGSVSRSPPLIRSTQGTRTMEENREETTHKDTASGMHSRTSSISSYDETNQATKRKRYDIDLDDENENRINRSVFEEIKNERETLESFLFNENNKISKNAIKFILAKWALLESKLQNEHLEKEKITASYNDYLSRATVGTYAQTLAGGISNRAIKHTEKDAKNKTKTNLDRKISNRDNKSNKIILVKTTGNKDTDSEEVKKKVIKLLKPNKDKIRIKNMRKARDSALIIDVEAEEDIEEIKKIDFNKEGLTLEQPRKTGPCIIIYDIDKNITKDEIRNNLWNKNLNRSGLSKHQYDEKIFFRYSLKNKDPKLVNWILEVPPRVYDVLLDRGRVYIEWKACRINEFINITRCFKCHGFGHYAKNCESEQQTCGHCGEKGHGFKECQKRSENPKCVCCIRSKRKNAEHSIKDKTCPEYIRQLQRYKDRINYTE